MDRQRQLTRSNPGPGSGSDDSSNSYDSGSGVRGQMQSWLSIAREGASECESLADAEGELVRRAQGPGQ